MDRSVKLLITLLALLGGLSVAPAQAQPCFGADARVEQVAGNHLTPVAVAAGSYRDTVRADGELGRAHADRGSTASSGHNIATVRQSDRARE